VTNATLPVSAPFVDSVMAHIVREALIKVLFNQSFN